MTPTGWKRGLAGVAGAALLLAVGGTTAAADAANDGPKLCSVDPSPPEYYAFPLVNTKRVPGTARADGRAEVVFGSTPYGVSLADDGSYLYELRLRIAELPDRENREYVAWVTTPSLDRIERVGAVGGDGALTGSVRWNKFLVVVTLEPEAAAADEDNGGNGSAAAPDSWSGPIVMRGMSQSGKMHTMAGHGPFQQENCAAYGYDD